MRDQTDTHSAKTHRNDNILICTCSTPAAHYKIKLSHKKYTRVFAEIYAPTNTNVTVSIAIAITPFLSNQLNISIRTHQSRGSKHFPARMRFPTRYMEHITLPYYMKKGYKDAIPRITPDYTAFPKKTC